jgi:adenosylcobinamide-phosphate synthase
VSVFAVVVALLLDFALMDQKARWHPARAMGYVTDTLEVICGAVGVSARAQGAVFVAAAACLFVFSSSFILLVASFSRPLLILIDGVMIYLAMDGTRVATEVSGAADAFSRDGAEEALVSLKRLAGIDSGVTCEEEIASCAIEALAEKFSDSVCATLFYAAIGGAPLAWLHRAVIASDAAAGYRDPGRSEFGWASARLCHILNYPPARISAAIVAVASPTVGGSIGTTLEGVKKDRGASEIPNAWYSLVAFADALGVTLRYDSRRPEALDEKTSAGTGQMPRIADVWRALCLYWSAYALAALAAVALGGILR